MGVIVYVSDVFQILTDSAVVIFQLIIMENRKNTFSGLLALHSGDKPSTSSKKSAQSNKKVNSPIKSSVTSPQKSKSKKLQSKEDTITFKSSCPDSNVKSFKNDGPVEMALSRKAPPPLWKSRKPQNTNRRVARDPRFDDLSGHLDVAAWSQNYKFIDDMRKKEKSALKKALSENDNAEERKAIKLELQRINNQEREKLNMMEQRRLKKDEKDNMISALKEGKTPYMKKKSDQKLEVLAGKFQRLKKENRLDKYLERKEKKQRAKELFKNMDE